MLLACVGRCRIWPVIIGQNDDLAAPQRLIILGKPLASAASVAGCHQASASERVNTFFPLWNEHQGIVRRLQQLREAIEYALRLRYSSLDPTAFRWVFLKVVFVGLLAFAPNTKERRTISGVIHVVDGLPPRTFGGALSQEVYPGVGLLIAFRIAVIDVCVCAIAPVACRESVTPFTRSARVVVAAATDRAR